MTTAEIIQLVVGALVTGDIALTVGVKKQITALLNIDSRRAAQIESMDQRLSRLERNEAVQAAWREDITGFLQKLDFKKRDGPPP